jgi:Ribbon-helix-helix protein, copG family
MAKKKSGRGGARPGAGRPLSSPSEGPVVTMAVSLPTKLMDALDARAEQERWTRSEAVVRAIRGLLGKRKPTAKG